MATALKLRRGTTSQHSTFTGAEGEVTVDTTKDTLVVHDGSTVGGFPLAREGISTTTQFPAGTVSAPSITTTGDTNTGIYFPAADTIAFTEGGVEAMRINSSGFVGINTNSPTKRLTVSSANYDDHIFVERTGVGGLSITATNPRGLAITDGTSTFLNIIQSTGSVGIGTSAPISDARLTLSVESGDVALALERSNSGLADAAIVNSAGNLIFKNGTNSSTVAGIAETMRIDSSGNVGIGTSSPTAKLYVYDGAGGTQVACIDGTGAPSLIFRSSGSQRGGIGQANGNVTGASSSDFAVQANSNLLFAAGGTTERMRLNSSGNLGLGVTPSTWSQGKAFEISAVGEGLWGNGLGDVWMMNGAYFNGGWKYSGTTKATAYRQGAGTTDGSHSWHIAPSGTAGNTITFTQAMTLDASGNLGVGTTSPSSRLHVEGTTLIQHKYTGVSVPILFGQYDATGNASINNQANGALLFGTNNTERARITSGGRLLVGTTTENTSGGVLQVSNGITFPATQSASSDANTLDDYEEGTWTPTLLTSGTNFTSVTYDPLTSGKYTKVGNVVHIEGQLRTDAITVGSASGVILIGGLPFTASATTQKPLNVGYVTAWVTNNPNSLEIGASGNVINVYYRSSVNGGSLQNDVASAGTGANSNTIYFAGTYTV